MAVTEVAMPAFLQRMAFKTISSAVTPLQNFLRSSSLPVSYTHLDVYKRQVMGCVVNGPGEASAADIGVAGGKGEGMIFRKGKVLYKVPQEKLVDALMEEIKKL